MSIEARVDDPYPCWVSLYIDGKQVAKIPHTQLLQLEHAVAEAKRQVLCKLDRRDWHQVDATLAGK